MAASEADLRRWVSNQEAVNARVAAERRRLTPAESFRKALRVGALSRAISGSQCSSLEETLRYHRVWAKLRSNSQA